MGRLLYFELVKTFLKKRTYIGFALVLLIIPLIEVAMKIEGAGVIRSLTRSLQEDFFFVGNLFNGWLVSYNMMNALWVHIPLLVSFVAGDMLAGEATAGTYRLILIRPVSRTRILFSKYIATLVYTVVFIFFLAALSIGLALLLLGRGDLVVMNRGILILPEAEVAWRFLVAYALASWMMLTIASLSFFFSSFVENAIGPIVGTMGVLIVSVIILTIPVDLFESIRPYLFMYYVNIWQKVFMDPVPWNAILNDALVLGAYSAAFVGATWFIFVRKDILS